MTQKNIAIFASGNGSNAEKFFEYFKGHPSIKIGCLLSNNENAYALTRSKNHDVPTRVINRKEFYESSVILEYLEEMGITHIVLAGFMWLIPNYLVEAYANNMVNIHPALLPKYGGKGMYGDHVHKAVIANREKQSGITIHYVNPIYDDGEIIFQAKCDVLPDDDTESLANRIHQLEHTYYPQVVEAVVLNKEIPSQ